MTLKQLNQLALLRQHEKYPNVPLHALYTRPLKVTSANELTRTIETYIRLTGDYADRVNNTGIYDKRTGKWRKGGTRKGIADIIAAKRITIGDRQVSVNVAIEVKFGTDRLSEHQKAMRDEITAKGGYYIVARTWEQFIDDWEAIK